MCYCCAVTINKPYNSSYLLFWFSIVINKKIKVKCMLAVVIFKFGEQDVAIEDIFIHFLLPIFVLFIQNVSRFPPC